MKNVLRELKKRNVYKVATAYLAASWLLIQVVSAIGSNFALTQSNQTFIYKLLVIGFPIALILAWVFELTPSGWKMTGKSQKESEENTQAGKNLNRFIITVLVVLLVFMLIDRFFLTGARLFEDQDKPTLAILPFENLSPSNEFDYIGEGLAIEMRDRLAKFPELDVIGESSSMIKMQEQAGIVDIAEDLRINFILKGGIRIAEDQMVFNVELINTKNKLVMWSNRYNEQLEDIINVQNEVAQKVVKELVGKTDLGLFKEEIDPEIVDPEAYKKYLRTKVLLRYRTNRDSLNLAKDQLAEVLAEFPDLAEGQASMAIVLHYMAVYGGDNDERDYEFRTNQMQQYVNAAKRLNPDLKEVYLADGILKGRRRALTQDSVEIQNLLKDELQLYQKALDQDPGYSMASNWYYLTLDKLKRDDEAVEVLQQAHENDPLNPVLTANRADKYAKNQDHESAMEIIDRVIRNIPNTGIERMKAGLLIDPIGDPVEALEFFYPYYKINLDDILYVERMLEIINELDMAPMADKLFNRLLYLRGARTIDGFWTMIFYNYQYDRLEENLEIFELEEARLNLPQMKAAADRHRAFIYNSLGQHEKAREIIEGANPELKSSTKGTHNFGFNPWDKMFQAFNYADVLRKLGNPELANYYADIACGLQEYFKEGEEVNLLGQARCAAARGRVSQMLEKLEQYYIKGGKYNTWELMGNGFLPYRDNPQLKEIIAVATERRHAMRLRAITYLEEQGEWDNEWNKELGID